MLSIAMLVYAISPEIEPMTLKNIDAVLKNTSGEFELRVLFNGGPTFPLPDDARIVPIRMGERCGIAEAYNLAFSLARGEVFLCLHNDVTVPPNWDTKLRLAALDGIAFPMLKEDNYEISIRGFGALPKNFPPGCCFAFKKSTYLDLGKFNEEYKDCHFEDTDFWMKAIKSRIPLIRCDVTVEHIRGFTRTMIPDKCNSSFQTNKQIYINNHTNPDGSVHIPLISETPEKKYNESTQQESRLSS